jgi:pentapeptide MXKDX repeat protein
LLQDSAKQRPVDVFLNPGERFKSHAPPKIFQAASNKAGPGTVLDVAAFVAFQHRLQRDDQTMTTYTRIALGVSAAVLSLSLALAPAAFAQDKMGKDDGMKKDTMSKDGMKKDDGMKDDGMKKDGMMKDDGMKKDGMKKDDGMKKN